MRSILYFALLFVVFGSPSLFAIEQFKEGKFDADDAVGSVHENIGIENNLKQDLSKSVTQENELESSKSDSVNVEKTQDAKIEGATNKKELQHHESKASIIEKAISEGKKIGKDVPDLAPKESMDEFA